MSTVKRTRKKRIVTISNPDSIISEQFRSLQTNIKFATGKKVMKSILITSPDKGAGKSTIALNLAVSLAQQKEKVLLIDANLKNPSIHKFLNITNNEGLTNLLLNEQLEVEFFVRKPDLGDLYILTSGNTSSHSTELISFTNLEQLLDSVHKAYDVIIIDSPSVLEVADTKILANYCDGIVLVYSKGQTKYDDALHARRELQFVEEKIVGVIMSDDKQSIFQKLRKDNK